MDAYDTPDDLFRRPKKRGILGMLGDGLLKGGKALAGAASGNPLAPVGLAADAVNTVADLVPDAAERRNNARVKALEGREKRNDLGLGGEQKERMQNSLMQPVRQGQTELGNVFSAAASQGGGAGELARIRKEGAQALGSAGQAAADRVYQADEDEKAANKQELEQRVANKAAGAQDARASVTGRIGDFLNTASQAVGSAPLNIMGPNGEAIKDEGEARRAMGSLGIGEDMQNEVLAMERRHPGYIAELFRRKQQALKGEMLGEGGIGSGSTSQQARYNAIGQQLLDSGMRR